ncbi:MAG: hypothetical protein LBS20_01480 [Prevotella sp.]|jgi:hypothetical protein|nr:hypothetical protein [Prevotella sp.]
MKNNGTTNWIIAIATVVNALVLTYQVFPISITKFTISSRPEISMYNKDGKLSVSQYFNFFNNGGLLSTILSIDALIVSLEKDINGNHTYLKHFTNIYTYDNQGKFYEPFISQIYYPMQMEGTWVEFSDSKDQRCRRCYG